MDSNVQLSAEMAKLVLAIESAKSADDTEYNKWRKNVEIAEKAWNKLSKEEQNKKIQQGGKPFTMGPAPVRRWTRAIRRQIRYKIFRIREGKWKDNIELSALKAWFEPQFQVSWGWEHFTFQWDLSAIDPLKIITPFEWDGSISNEYVLGAGGKINGKYCDPPAFTNQSI